MDERADRGEFYPGGREGGVPPGTSTDKVDRVNLGELGESYTLKDVRQKVNQIVRAMAPAVSCLAMCAWAATAPLKNIPSTAPVVTNEEDAVAMAAVGALGAAVSNKVEAAEGALQAEIAGATNAVVQAALRAAEAESNRVESTYAKLSDIPAQPDLSHYALKSELPQDYLVESDITNFATRAWINSQNYAREGAVYARLDLQDLAIAAASNALWAAHLAEAARLNAASNALWSATLRADEALQREIDSLRIVAADSNAVTRLMTPDGKTWQDATGVVWRVEDALGPWTATTNSVVFGSWDQAQPDMDPDLYAIYFAANGTNAYAYTDAPGNKTNEYIGTSWYWSDWYGPEAEAAKFPITFVRDPIPGGTTNAVRQVAYTNDIPSTNGLASAAALDDLEGRLSIDIQANAGNIENLQLAIPAIGPAATNYTDAAANAATNYANDVSNNLAVVIADMASHIGSSDRISDGTNVITSAGDVFHILVEDESWSYTVSPALPEGAAINIGWGPTLYFPDDEQWYALVAYPGGGGPFPLGGSESSTNLVLVSTFAESSPEYTVIFTRHLAGETNFVGRLALTNDIPEISTNNAAFVAAVLAAPIVGASPSDLADIAEYGSYGTVGAAILALIAGLAALKRDKANKADLPYPFVPATVTQGEPQLPASAFPIAGSYDETSFSFSASEVSMAPNAESGEWYVLSNSFGSIICVYTSAGAFSAAGTNITNLTFGGSSTPPSMEFPNVLTITPRTVATYTAGTTAAAFSIAVSAGVSSAARDCELVIDCTATGAVAPTVTWPSNFHPRTDAEEIAPVDGVRNVFYISEYATGQFVVGGWHEEAE